MTLRCLVYGRLLLHLLLHMHMVVLLLQLLLLLLQRALQFPATGGKYHLLLNKIAHA